MEFDWDKTHKPQDLESKGRPSFEQVLEAIADGYLIANVENDTHAIR